MKTPDEIKRGLKCCASENGCVRCPYKDEDMPYVCVDVVVDALAYIRQLEARVAELEKPLEPMTLEEAVRTDEDVWLEQMCGSMFASRLTCYDAKDDVYATHTLAGKVYGLWPGRYYNKGWRCWSRRPTDKERKAAVWDE